MHNGARRPQRRPGRAQEQSAAHLARRVEDAEGMARKRPGGRLAQRGYYPRRNKEHRGKIGGEVLHGPGRRRGGRCWGSGRARAGRAVARPRCRSGLLLRHRRLRLAPVLGLRLSRVRRRGERVAATGMGHARRSQHGEEENRPSNVPRQTPGASRAHWMDAVGVDSKRQPAHPFVPDRGQRGKAILAVWGPGAYACGWMLWKRSLMRMPRPREMR